MFDGEIPQLQKHGGQIGDAAAGQLDAGVLPVSKPVHLVDVFVSEVDAAGIADVSVNDADFSVVTIVQVRGDERKQAVKTNDLHAHRPKFFVVVMRERGNTSHIVIHQTDFDALRGLLPQNFQDGIPHDAALDDEKLDENKALSFFQIHQHRIVQVVAEREIFRGGVFPCGHLHNVIEIFAGSPVLRNRLAQRACV